ncbi:STAS-like domain-containing protein [Staphylococcus aureus]|jgi:hypothetical protein|uniref:DUF4325 domain-containing protein n=1 Tax=Staphylococcus aureus TaxID=1280 RepID=A0AAN1ZRA2_STAAU|nr:STAS-like domain-containing protein [Staphylococcus aureus]MRF33386.1 DUF4325 domain-containing protein [Staphylococcus sp. KY49P]HAR4209998.1 STAS-like domain-containing protein [Staphylococcus aureus ADL-210]HAR4233450.1 STAS-like domain-containing protein [Staphylococcus aureus ADL-206]ANI75102.1 hypothetical protein A7327_11830 [Staphylococcus aureus]EJX2106201.1 STAS-like domain-containing protein [Staphylococcus aureus]
MKSIEIKSVLNSNLAVTSDQAEIIYKLLSDSIKKGENIEVNFEGITVLTTAFLNAAIGRLYDIADSKQLNEYVKINTLHLNNSHFNKIKMVMSNSREKREANQVLMERVLNDGY